MGAPIRYNGGFFAAERPSPAKGQHTREVLAEIGYGPAEIEGFLRAGSAFVEAGLRCAAGIRRAPDRR